MTLSERQQINDQADGNKNLQVVDESAKSQDFFQDNNALGKQCTTTQIKSTKFVSNITYVGINKEDYYKEDFIFDVYLLVTKNLKPFSLDRKLANKNKHKMISTCSGKNTCHKYFTGTFTKKKTFCILMVKTCCSLKC